MAITQVTMYRTSGGDLFDTQSAAEAHETIVSFALDIRSQANALDWEAAKNLAKYLIRHYYVTHRE